MFRDQWPKVTNKEQSFHDQWLKVTNKEKVFHDQWPKVIKNKILMTSERWDNPFAKGLKEDDLITETALEDEGISDEPDEANALRKHENVKVQYQKALAYIRELTNHTFLRAVYHTSSHQAQIEYKEVQQTFLIEHANDKLEDGREPEKFTALNIIAHILKECLCENDKSLVLIQNTFNELIRHNGQSPLKWRQSMLPIQTRYRKAIGKDLDEDEQKRVWKLHFARQIIIAEQTTIITFRSTHLEITEMREIEDLRAPATKNVPFYR